MIWSVLHWQPGWPWLRLGASLGPILFSWKICGHCNITTVLHNDHHHQAGDGAHSVTGPGLWLVSQANTGLSLVDSDPVSWWSWPGPFHSLHFEHERRQFLLNNTNSQGCPAIFRIGMNFRNPWKCFNIHNLNSTSSRFHIILFTCTWSNISLHDLRLFSQYLFWILNSDLDEWI